MRETRESGGKVVKDTAFDEGKQRRSSAIMVPRHCPFVFFVKVGWRECKAFENAKRKSEISQNVVTAVFVVVLL
jgi:hypothetical protein